MKGTRVLSDWYFLCGHKAYLSLPEGWGGLCALVKLSDHVEINRYALLRHTSLTKVLGTALAEEQKTICTIVLQNRLTLDLITASQSGVYKLIDETCCTFIPEGYSTGGNIHEALKNLTVLQRYVADHTPGASTQDGLAWLTSGPWWHMLLKILNPVFVVLLSVCCGDLYSPLH